jgi:hypothetical protein
LVIVTVKQIVLPDNSPKVQHRHWTSSSLPHSYFRETFRVI